MEKLLKKILPFSVLPFIANCNKCLFLLSADCLRTPDEFLKRVSFSSVPQQNVCSYDSARFLPGSQGKRLAKGPGSCDVRASVQARFMINTFKHVDMTVCTTRTYRPLSVCIHAIFLWGGVDTRISFPSPRRGSSSTTFSQKGLFSQMGCSCPPEKCFLLQKFDRHGWITLPLMIEKLNLDKSQAIQNSSPMTCWEKKQPKRDRSAVSPLPKKTDCVCMCLCLCMCASVAGDGGAGWSESLRDDR